MDIRTKLIFTLVVVALSSMFVLGAVLTPIVEERLQLTTLAQLDELAESKREALFWIVQGWRDRTALVASRTQLRASLAEHARTGSPDAVARMRTILADALRSSETLTLLRVHDSSGAIVASAVREGEAPLPSRALTDTGPRATAPAYAGVEFVGSGPPQVSFVAGLAFEGRALGTLVAVFRARELIDLTSRALGETGEVLLIAPDAAGASRTLHPTRLSGSAGAGVSLSQAEGSLAARAYAEEGGLFSEGVTDYRGEPVWVATRLVSETGWGLVVKVDDAEEREPYATFVDSLRGTAIILSAFAILAGFVLGFRIALPIHDLAEAANKIRQGEMGARARVTSEDEVGLLARTFNEMAGEIEEQMALLHEFRKFFDVSIDMMCMAGTDGFFKRLNPAFVRELGWSEEELLERSFLDFVHPDDVERTQQEIVTLSQGIPTISFENRYRCKDGSYKRLRWASYPEAETGMLYAIAHVMEEGRASVDPTASSDAG